MIVRILGEKIDQRNCNQVARPRQLLCSELSQYRLTFTSLPLDNLALNFTPS